MAPSPLRQYQGAARADLRFSSFRQMLDSRAGASPFLVYYDGPKRIHEINYGDFIAGVRACTAHLAMEFGIKPGDRVAVLAGNGWEAFPIYGAILALQATIVPLNPEDSPATLAVIREHCEAKILVYTEKFATLALQLGGPSAPFGEAWLKNDSGWPASSTPAEEATLFYTSGTTGAAKGVSQSLHAHLTNLEATVRAGELKGSDVLMSCLPLYHVNAFNFSFLLPLYLGCPIVYQNRFHQLGYWDVVRRENVSVISLVPTIASLLVKERRSENPGRLRYAISAASALPRETLMAFKEKFGVRINQAYGLSETVNFTLFTPPGLSPEEYAAAAESEPMPSAGTPTWGNEVQLRDVDGRPVESAGEKGEICVRGWSVMRGYSGNETATKAAFEGGSFHTGDIAYFREIGGRRFYFLCGRIKEVIKRNGELIYLPEIDIAARELGLENAYAVGFENSHTGEEVGLYLCESADPIKAGEEEILARLRQRLGPSKCPKVIARGPQIPLTSVGKVRRRELASYFERFREKRF